MDKVKKVVGLHILNDKDVFVAKVDPKSIVLWLAVRFPGHPEDEG